MMMMMMMMMMMIMIIMITRDEAWERRCQQIVVERSRHAASICEA